MNFMIDNFRPDTDTRLASLIKLYRLSAEPLYQSGDGGVANPDRFGLIFGARYRVIRRLDANGHGSLQEGEKVYFLGGYHPALYGISSAFFERADGSKVELNFDPTSNCPGQSVNRMTPIETFMRPIRFDFSKRGKQLTAARAVLLHLRKNEA